MNLSTNIFVDAISHKYDLQNVIDRFNSIYDYDYVILYYCADEIYSQVNIINRCQVKIIPNQTKEQMWNDFRKYVSIQKRNCIITNHPINDPEIWPYMIVNYEDNITIQSRSIVSDIFDYNRDQRKFVFSDVHGCYEQLKELTKTINYQPHDKIICLGDLVDRGPNSKECIQYCIDLIGNKLFVKGNHEEMFLQYLTNPKLWFGSYIKPSNGGYNTLRSYLDPSTKIINIPESHIEFMETMSDTFIEDDSYIYVHAGLNPNLPLSKQIPEDCRWIRYEFLNSKYYRGKIVVHGHTVTETNEIERYKNRIAIDCGCVFGGSLGCIDLNHDIDYYVKHPDNTF